MLAKMWRKGNPTLLVRMQTGAATVENSMDFPKKLKTKLPFDPVIPLLGIYPKNSKTPTQKNLCTPVLIAVTCIMTKIWKQLQCPSVDEWIQ